MKKTIDLENEFEELKKVHPTSPVSLSYENIMNKIKLTQREKAPKVLVISALLVLFVLFSVNIITFRNQEKAQEKNLVKELGLMNNLSIYGGI